MIFYAVLSIIVAVAVYGLILETIRIWREDA